MALANVHYTSSSYIIGALLIIVGNFYLYYYSNINNILINTNSKRGIITIISYDAKIKKTNV